VAPERGCGEGDLEMLGDSVSPRAATGPHGQVLATVWPLNRVMVPGDLGEVASPLAFRMIWEKGSFTWRLGLMLAGKGLRARVILD
jgi:hypothetical protein